MDRFFDRFLVDLGSVLGGFWRPSWAQNRPEIGQKSVCKPIENMIKKCTKKGRPRPCNRTQHSAGREGWGPLNKQIQGDKGTSSRPSNTPLVVPGAQWWIYIQGCANSPPQRWGHQKSIQNRRRCCSQVGASYGQVGAKLGPS